MITFDPDRDHATVATSLETIARKLLDLEARREGLVGQFEAAVALPRNTRDSVHIQRLANLLDACDRETSESFAEAATAFAGMSLILQRLA